MPALGLSPRTSPQPTIRRATLPPPLRGFRASPPLDREPQRTAARADPDDLAEEEPGLIALRGAVLSALSVGLFTVQKGGRVLDLNRAGESLLAKGRVRRRGGALTTASSSETRRLERLIAAATEPAPARCGAMRIEHEDGTACVVTVTPLDSSAAREPAALVLVQELEAGSANPRHLQAMFGLTEAEAELAALFGQGLSLPAVAEVRQVSTGTVKSQLKAITAKLGVSRQSELAALVASLPKLATYRPRLRAVEE